MVTQPAYLSAFKAYTRIHYGDAEMVGKVVDDLSNESDRGAVILSATGLEDFLENAIGMRLPTLENDVPARAEIFGADGVCGTFANKIRMAYAMGIIFDKSMRTKIDLVREIRNGCAHGRQPLSFTNPVLSDICKVVIGEEFLSILKNHDPDTIRKAFVIAVSNIQLSIAERRWLTPGEAFLIAQKHSSRGE